MNIQRMTPIEQNSFLYLMNNYNVAMVGFSKGKSTSYLASIFSSIKNSNNDEMCNGAIEPKAIVLSNSLGSCTALESLSKALISSTITKTIKIVVVYSSIPLQQTLATLCNGCDVLIATPTSLQNLLNKTKIFSWLKLRHFVFDNTDVLLENYEDQMPYFFNILKKLNEKTNKIQMISASVKWTKDMDTFFSQLFVKWQYIFGSHLEAARFQKVGFHVIHVKDKLESISNYLKNVITCNRCVLIASNTNELGTISNYIQQNNSDFEVLLPDVIKSANVYTLQNWNKPLEKNKIIFICSDDMMYDFYIDNADSLIHYDVPVDKKNFSIRFSVLQNSNNILVEKERNAYIFLSTNKDMLQLPKIVEVMQKFGNGEVDPILLKHAKIINENIEKEKKKNIFCHAIKQFGYCPKYITCQSRHFLVKELDEPASNIPKSGLAIIQVLNVYDASHIAAKLLKFSCSNNVNDVHNWSSIEDHSATINDKLSLFYSNQKNRIHEKPKPGDTVAVQLEIKNREHINIEYYRSIVIDLVDTFTMNPKVTVKLIDKGIIETVSIWRVFVLPDVLKYIPTTTVDVFLTSVKPIDYDKTWFPQANVHVKKKLQHIEDCNDTIIVKIKMALGTTIWIKKLYRKYFNLNMYNFEAILPDTLFDVGYADKNCEHIEKLKELSNLAGINIPSTLKKNVEDKLTLEKYKLMYNLPQPQWAHLDQNITVVSVEYIMGPKLFFVRNSKYSDCLNDLQKKIDSYVEQKQVTKLKHFVEGAICLATDPESEKIYSRAQIYKILDDKVVEVLFVDIGELNIIKRNSLLTIHPDLIIQLPFQAIECSLSGVMDELPTDKIDELIDYVYDLTEKPLYSKIIRTIETPVFTGNSHYEVILYDNIMTVNLMFSKEFSQYCDDAQMSKLKDVVDKIEKDDILGNEYDKFKKMLEEDDDENEDDIDMHSVNEIPKIEFLNEFGLAVFGQKIFEDMKDLKSVAPVPINENVESTNKIEEIIPLVDSVVLNKKPLELKTQKLNLYKKNLNYCVTCNTNVHSIVPTCIWYQDKNYIYLKLSILEVEDFNINCTMENIIFNAKFKDLSYSFCAKLFGLIFEHNVTHKRSYEGFHIKAEKLYKTEYKWPRLFECSKRHKEVKYDPDHIEAKNYGPWLKTMNKLKMIALGTSFNNIDDENGSDSSSNDEDFLFDNTDELY